MCLYWLLTVDGQGNYQLMIPTLICLHVIMVYCYCTTGFGLCVLHFCCHVPINLYFLRSCPQHYLISGHWSDANTAGGVNNSCNTLTISWCTKRQQGYRITGLKGSCRAYSAASVYPWQLTLATTVLSHKQHDEHYGKQGELTSTKPSQPTPQRRGISIHIRPQT